ncbi:hypothetical protein KC678_04905 [Candidatus Dojkabacteria bacterium]|uniref:Uncharacterized protein n=1 Tax=Candidatus Dojkabacteria bacterium TaxID=2099670 RepID=A0A955L294_9BACT|nr:hypothetical protein [Candidatus Dojkabacteria bacterium]
MQLSQLSKTLLEKINNRSIITQSDYPERIILDSKINKSIKVLSNYTDPRNSKKEGPSGWEYEQSVFYFDGELFLSEIVAGNYESVKPSHSFKANPEYSKDKTKYFYNIFIDKKKYKSNMYNSSNGQENKLVYGFILSFHTHPKNNIKNKSIYSFFSLADIKSLLYGRSPILGLIWGNCSWLVCKTSSSTIPSQELLNKISRAEYDLGIEGVINAIKQELSTYDLVFYQASLGNIFKRI